MKQHPECTAAWEDGLTGPPKGAFLLSHDSSENHIKGCIKCLKYNLDAYGVALDEIAASEHISLGGFEVRNIARKARA